MAKSLRSKVKKRWRALRKNYVDQIKVRPELQEISKKLQATIVGVEYRTEQPKNAFLHPEDPSAHFPQYVPQKNIDLRSTSIPGSGNQYSGASRKYTSTLPGGQNKEKEQNTNNIEDQEKIEEQQSHLKTTIKKDRNKKSKLRKIMVF